MIYETVVVRGHAYRAVSLESSVVANGVQAVINFFPSVFKSINAGFSTVKEIKLFKAAAGDADTLKLSKKEQSIVDALVSVPYDDLIKLRVPVPEGFVGSYVNYLIDVQQLFDYHQNVCLPALESFYIEVASVITNKGAKISQKSIIDSYKSLIKSREENNKKITDYFVIRSTQSEQDYGKIFHNNEEVGEMFKERHKLVKTLEAVNVKQVTDYVNKINDALVTLIKIAEDKSMSNLSAVQLQNITEGAYECAAQVEFFAVNYYRAQTLINTITHLQDKLLRRLD